MAYTAINPTQLTPPRVALIDERSGAISREWYRFFLSLLTATEQTQNAADNIAPDTSSLLASYDTMLADLAQSSNVASDGNIASLESSLNNLQYAFDITPTDLGGTVTSVAASGGTTGLTFSGSPITTSGTLTLGGTLAVANGGTGQTSYTNGQLLIGNTTGNTLSKATLTAGTNISITNGAGSITINAADAYTGTVTSVSVVSANGFAGTVANPTTTPAITISTTATGVLKGNGTAISAALAGTDYVAPGAITGSGLTMATARLLGRTTASSGAVEEITVGTGLSLTGGTLSSTVSGTVTSVDVSGGTTGLSFSGGPITTSGTITMSGTLGVANGGTGATTLTSGYLLKGNGTSAVSASVAYDNGSAILIGTTTAKSRLTVSSAAFSNAPVLGSAGGIVNFSNPDINYGFLIGVNSADGHAWLQAQRTDGTAASGPITLNEAGGNVAIGKSTAATALDVNGTVTATSFTGAGTGLTGTASALSIGGNAATATTATTATSATTAGSVTNSVTFNNGGAGDASGTSFNGSVARTISYNTIGAQPSGTYVTSVTGTAPVVSSGGTTPAISMAAATTSVNGYLTSTDWTTFNGKQAALVSGTNIKTVNGTTLLGSGDLGTITAGYGGTGQSSYTVGDILYASGTTALSKLADVATGNALISGGVGVAPSYGKIGLTTHVSGTLPVGNGGTNLTAFTANGVVYASSTSALATGSALTFDGTNFATTGTASATKFIPTGGTATGNGMYLPTTNVVAFSTNGAERVRIASDGSLLVNTTASLGGNTRSEFKETSAGTWPLVLNGNDRGMVVRNSAAVSGFYAYFEYNGGTNNGSIAWAAGVTSYNTTSDARIKDNIVDAPDAGILLDDIKVRSWDFKTDGNHWRYGMVAQELLQVFPEAVSVPSDEEMMMGVDYSKIVPLLIKEVQSLRRRVAMLENM
jgi:hypothetical protein